MSFAAASPGPDETELPFQQLAQSLAIPCWISDPEGRIVWVNDAWLDYTGADVETLSANGLKPLHDSKIYGDVVRKWMAVKAAGAAGEMVFPLRGRDGQLRPFHTRVTPLRDAEGRISRWFGSNVDISDQSRTEARLRTSEEQWREVFERAGDAIFITDADGRLVDVNAAACAMGQYSRDALLEMSVWDLIDVREHVALRDARARDDSVRDWRIKRKDGSFLAVEVSSRRLSDGRRLGVARDVSARRLAEAAERRALADLVSEERARATDAERRLQRFWDASRDLFAIVSEAQGAPMLINERAWRETLGYTAEEMARTPLYDLIHPDDRDRTIAQRAANLGEASYYGFENRYRRRDGAWVWLSWNVVRDGELIYCSARDISEEKRAEAELERASARLAQAQKMEAVGQVTGGVAHDFNNLLMVMAGQAELMRGRLGDDPRAVRSLNAILDAARRGQALTGRLLAFSRRQRLRPTPVSLASRAAQLQPLLASSLGASVDLEIDCPAELWAVEVDAGEWEVALLNMAVNARDAMPEGGRFTITARNTRLDPGDGDDALGGDFVEVTVADTGEGIPDDVLPRVADPFFTTKPVNRGTGLGLSQVDGFVQQSGGRMRIESQLGHGTTIRICLPRAAAAAPVDTRGAAPPAEPRRLDILCVEDNPEVADVAAGLIEQLGHRVRVVGSARAAMELLGGGARPDLVFSDIVMAGDVNGLELARHIRETWPALPVLLTTGYSREAQAIGDEFAVLAKPYQLSDLAGALQAAASTASRL
jgi:PAS domain S-box-containing protein